METTTMIIETADSRDPGNTALQCMEIWGGNSSTERDVATPGLDIHVHSRPYRQSEGGGDVHYVSLCGGGMITRLILADVSGHGASVSEVAKSLRALMRKHINRKDQSELVASLNREFTDLIEMRRFATAVVATSLSTTDRLSISNAGHPAPMLRRARDRTWCYLDQPVVQGSVSDIPLGIEESAQYGSHELTLEPEDLVLFHTDAFIEAEDPQGRLLGEEGLLELVRAINVDDPSAFSRALLEAIERCRGGAEATDDETFILLRHNAGPARRRGIVESLKVYAKVLGLSETRRSELAPPPPSSSTDAAVFAACFPNATPAPADRIPGREPSDCRVTRSARSRISETCSITFGHDTRRPERPAAADRSEMRRHSVRFPRLVVSMDRGVGSIRRIGKHGCTPSPELLEARELLASSPFASLTRSEAAAWYRDVFDPLAAVAPGWTGDVAAGIPGSLSTSYRNATLGRINAYRYLAGLNDDVGLDPEKNRLAQAAALLMSANHQLSHQPPTTWTHYTPDGAEGAGNSNLALGAAGSFAIDLYMEEPAPAGHRRWLLYPPQTQIGIGDIPTPSGGYRPSNAVHVLRFDGPRPDAPYVAWPAPGYVHHLIVPDAWSFAVDDSADFSSASVSVVSGSTSLPVSVVSRGGPNYGDPAIEWTVVGVTDQAPLADRDLEVEISGVRVDGVVRSFRYAMTIFDPDQPGDDSPVPPPDPGNGGSSSVAFANPQVLVGESASFVDVLLSRSGALAQAASIGYATLAGTAGTDDFVPVSGRATFAPGSATALIRVQLLPDRLAEPTETFFIRLSDPIGLSVVGSTSATISILDDDSRQPRIVAVRGLRTRRALTEVAISFDGTVGTPTPSSLATIQLRRAGRDRRFGTRDDTRLALRGILLDEATGEIRLRLSRAFQPRELLQLVVSAGGLRDSAGALLDFEESLGVSAWSFRA